MHPNHSNGRVFLLRRETEARRALRKRGPKNAFPVRVVRARGLAVCTQTIRTGESFSCQEKQKLVVRSGRGVQRMLSQSEWYAREAWRYAPKPFERASLSLAKRNRSSSCAQEEGFKECFASPSGTRAKPGGMDPNHSNGRVFLLRRETETRRALRKRGSKKCLASPSGRRAKPGGMH